MIEKCKSSLINKLSEINKKKVIIHLIEYSFLFLLFYYLSSTYLVKVGLFENVNCFLLSVGACFVIYMHFYFKFADKKNYRKNEEYGSSKWGTKQEISPYIDPIFEKNIIFTQTERMMMNSRPKNYKVQRNKNVLVVGGSGSGKTRGYVKPNIEQLHSSYVVTDPKGTILTEVGKLLERGRVKRDADGKIMLNRKGKPIYEPYKIKVFNTINFKKSMHYNPFAYIKSEKDIMTFVNALMENTKGEGEKSGEDFWIKAEKLYYYALIGYIYYKAPKSEQNFSTLLELINASEVREDDESFKNAVDLLFESLEREDPDNFAVRQYKKYKLAAGKTAKSILVSCGARLGSFDTKEMREITEYDELELDELGNELSALFVIISDTDTTFNFIVGIMYTQLFNVLCKKADDVYSGRLPIHVRLILDEFANIGKIPHFKHLIATIRSREISCSIILQSLSQLKSIYKDDTETIVDNCDTTLFLGGKGEKTVESISKSLGKETIDIINTSETRGREKSYGSNFQKTGRELLTLDEVGKLARDECILMISGLNPFKSKKYMLETHPNYKYTADADEKNYWDIEKNLNKKIKFKVNRNEPMEFVEININEEF